MNLRRDTLLAGVLIVLCCSSLVTTQEAFAGALDFQIFTAVGNIASLGAGVFLGYHLKQCPECPDGPVQTVTEPMPSPACPDLFNAVIVGEVVRCYYIGGPAMNRELASRECALPQYAHGRLLSIETEAEETAVFNFFRSLEKGAVPTYLWISATDLDDDKNYTWENGKAVDNPTFLREIPDGKCAVVDTADMTLGRSLCQEAFKFICESDPVQQS